MNAEQKQRIAHEISNWRNAAQGGIEEFKSTGERMAALLQELVDAPEPDPVGYATTSLHGSFGIGDIDGCKYVKPGTILYARPPTPAEAPADVARDAARYRWLQRSNWYVGPDSFYCTEGGDLVEYNDKNVSAENLNAEIDAAIAAEKGGTQ